MKFLTTALALAIVVSTNGIGAHIYTDSNTGKPAHGPEIKAACEAGELPAMEPVCVKYRRHDYFPRMRPAPKKGTNP